MLFRFFAFGLPRFFGAGGVLSIARTASLKLPVMGETVVSALTRFGTSSISCALLGALVSFVAFQWPSPTEGTSTRLVLMP